MSQLLPKNQFILAVEPPKEGYFYGVIVMDLPGCCGGGETFEETLEDAKEAIELHVTSMLDEGEDIPPRYTLDKHVMNPEYIGCHWATIEVDIPGL